MLTIKQAILTQYRIVTDRQTDRRTDRQTSCHNTHRADSTLTVGEQLTSSVTVKQTNQENSYKMAHRQQGTLAGLRCSFSE